MFYSEKLVREKGRMRESWLLAHGRNPEEVDFNRRPVHDLCVDLKRWIKSKSENPRRRLSLSLASKFLAGTVRVYDLQLNRLLDDCTTSLYPKIPLINKVTQTELHFDIDEIMWASSDEHSVSNEAADGEATYPTTEEPVLTPGTSRRSSLRIAKMDAEKENMNKIQMTWRGFDELRQSVAQDPVKAKPKRKKQRRRSRLTSRTAYKNWRQRKTAIEDLISRPSHPFGCTLRALYNNKLKKPPTRQSVDREFFVKTPKHPTQTDDIDDLQLRKKVSQDDLEQSQELLGQIGSGSKKRKTKYLPRHEHSMEQASSYENGSRIYGDDEEHYATKFRDVGVMAKPTMKDVATNTPVIVTECIGTMTRSQARARGIRL